MFCQSFLLILTPVVSSYLFTEITNHVRANQTTAKSSGVRNDHAEAFSSIKPTVSHLAEWQTINRVADHVNLL